MKKILGFLILGVQLLALDFTTEIDSKYQTDFKTSSIPINLKLTSNYSSNNIYSEFQIEGDNITNTLDLSKAYGEVYKDKLTLTFGRQPISWGNAYIFNRLNSITRVNILNPSEKTSTLDGIKFKYALADSSRLEAIVFEENDASDNYALRYSFLVKNYELMFNYLNKNDKTNEIIFDLKGDMVVGIWTQYAYSFETNSSFYLLGTDYSFSFFDKTLYLLWEGSYDENKSLLLNYFRYNYGFSDWTSLNGGLLVYKDQSVLTTTLNHKLNDEVELNLSYVYIDSLLYQNLTKNSAKNKIELQIKAVF